MFPEDLFMQMWEGSWVAWLAFAMCIVSLGVIVFLIILWWKLPQPAKMMFLNVLHGGRPVVANALDDHSVKFHIPTIFKEAILYSKGFGWGFLPRLTQEADKLLGNEVNKDVVTNAFRIQGAPGAFYMAYSGKGTIVNPELQNVMQYTQQYKKMAEKKNPHGFIEVPKESWINALQSMKDKFVQIEPVYVTTLLNPLKIKEYLPKAYTKSQLLAQEQKVREMERNLSQGSPVVIMIFLVVVVLLMQVVSLAKIFGMF